MVGQRIKSTPSAPPRVYPCRSSETRTVSDQGETPRDGVTAGELEVRGPWVAGSYYGLDQADKWTADGWLRTEDVGTLDDEGYLKITDRLKDLIKSGGEWISSVELENALVAHESVKEAAVIAVPHIKWQERPLALVVLKEGFAVEAAELRVFLERRFPRWHVPDEFDLRGRTRPHLNREAVEEVLARAIRQLAVRAKESSNPYRHTKISFFRLSATASVASKLGRTQAGTSPWQSGKK